MQDIVTENKKYIGQLSYYLGPAPEVISMCQSARYTQKDLVTLFQSYYQASGKESSFTRPQEKLKYAFAIHAGPVMHTISFQSEGFEELREGNPEPDLSYAIGGSLDFILPRNFERISVSNELMYTSYHFHFHFEDIQSDDVYTITDSDLAYSYLNYALMMKYSYTLGNLKLWAKGGISSGYAFNETNQYETVSRFYVDNREYSGRALEQIRSWETSLVFGTGAGYKSFSGEFRFQQGNGMSIYEELYSGVTRLYFLLSYTF